jgi:hypothetical protein
MDLEPEKPKKPLIFSCETCNFNTSNKKDYRRHVLTRKHKNGVKTDNIEPEIEQKTPPEFSCGKCGKGYNAKNSLWYHSKTCTVVAPPEKSTVDQSKILIELLQNNNEFKQMMVDQTNELTNKIVEVVRTNQMTITNNTNNNNRTINNHFNLNLFLNENDNLKRMHVITGVSVMLNRPDHNRDWDFGYISDKLGIEYYFDIKPMQQYNFELSDLIQLSNIVKFKSMYVQDCLDAGEIIYHSDKYPRWWIYQMWTIAFILYKNGYLFSLELEDHDIFLNIIR